MKNGQDFIQIGKISKGELVLKLPGADLKMSYKKGKAFLNDFGVGYVSLPIRDVYCEENWEPSVFRRSVGRLLVEQLNNLSSKPIFKKKLALRDFILFYSLRQDGMEILCLPSMLREDVVDGKSIPNMIVAKYSTGEGIPPIEYVYAHHMGAVGKRKLVTDKNKLETEVLQLVPKANAAYERPLRIMNEFWSLK